MSQHMAGDKGEDRKPVVELGPPKNQAERVERWRTSSWKEPMIYERGVIAPSKSVEVTTVVPIYGELANNNVWRTIESMTEQTADTSRFEVIFVVNNDVVSVKKKTNVFYENQKTIALIRILQASVAEVVSGKSSATAVSSGIALLRRAGITLSDWQMSVFTNGIKRKIRVSAVDASSRDVAPSEKVTDYNMAGVARHIGGKVAYRRFYESGKVGSGLIDFIDGDCTMPNNYYEKIIAARDRNPKQRSFKKDVLPYAADIPDWSDMPPLARMSNLFLYLRMNISRRRLHQVKVGGKRETWGPAPVVGADIFRDVKGYPSRAGSGEDIAFAHAVSAIQRSEFISGTYVRFADRESDNSVSVTGTRFSKFQPRPGTTKDIASFAQSFVPNDLKGLSENNTHPDYNFVVFARNVLATDKQLSGDSAYLSLRRKRWQEEVHESIRRVQALQTIVAAVVRLYERKKPRQALFKKGNAYRAYMDGQLKNMIAANHLEYLKDNPIVTAALVTVCELMAVEKNRVAAGIGSHGTLQKDVWAFFETFLPEQFVALSTTEPDYRLLEGSVVSGGQLPQGYSMRHLSHLALAQRDHELGRT